MFILQVVKNILRTSEGSTAYDMLMRIINRGADVQLVRSAIFFSAFFTFGTEKISSLRCRKGELLKAMDGVSCLLLSLFSYNFVNQAFHVSLVNSSEESNSHLACNMIK